jgi:hypothetical protein
MSDHIHLPPLSEIEDRLRACREEMHALKKLHRLAKADQQARETRTRHDMLRTSPLEAEVPHVG